MFWEMALWSLLSLILFFKVISKVILPPAFTLCLNGMGRKMNDRSWRIFPIHGVNYWTNSCRQNPTLHWVRFTKVYFSFSNVNFRLNSSFCYWQSSCSLDQRGKLTQNYLLQTTADALLTLYSYLLIDYVIFSTHCVPMLLSPSALPWQSLHSTPLVALLPIGAQALPDSGFQGSCVRSFESRLELLSQGKRIKRRRD